MLLVSSSSCLYPIRWSQVLSWGWRCSWSSADRRCSNYIWVINNLTHWGRVTHICVSKITIIGSDNGLSPGRRQAIIWTNVGILLIGPLANKLRWNFNRNSNIFIQENAFESVVCEMTATLSWPQCVNRLLKCANIRDLTQVTFLDSCDLFTHTLQGCFSATGSLTIAPLPMIWLFQYQSWLTQYQWYDCPSANNYWPSTNDMIVPVPIIIDPVPMIWLSQYQ